MSNTEINKKAYTSDPPVEYAIYYPDQGSNEVKITIRSSKKITTVTFRNVGVMNPDAAIQFNTAEYNQLTNRTKYTSFSIPQELTDIFLTHLNTAK